MLEFAGVGSESEKEGRAYSRGPEDWNSMDLPNSEHFGSHRDPYFQIFNFNNPGSIFLDIEFFRESRVHIF